MPTDVTALRAEHDQVLARLSARESTRCFAQGAVSLFVAALALGTAGKLAWDFWGENPEWALGAAAVAAGLLGYALARLWKGRGLYASERGEVARLLQLRAQLGVDPAASITER